MTRKLFSLSGLLLLLVVLAACGTNSGSWAGVTAVEEPEATYLIVSYRDFIAKVDLDGDRQWAYPDDENRGPDFFAAAAVDEDVLYVGDYEGGVHAVDLETGDPLWVNEQQATNLFGFINFGGSTDRVIGEIAVGDGVLYVPDEHGVYALDQSTGERIEGWDLETERAVWSQPLYVPATEDQPAQLYVASLDQYIYAVDPATGEVFWKTDLDAAAPAAPTYDAERDVLFVGTFGQDLFAINAEDGAILDRYEVEGWLWDQPTLSEGQIFIGDLDGYLYALDFAEGAFEELWSEQLEDAKIRAQPLVTEALVLASTSNGHVYALNRETGQQEWRTTIEDEPELLSRLILAEFVEEETGDLEPVIVTATDDVNRLVVRLRLENGNTTGARYETQGLTPHARPDR
ncbi:MAG: PQQ-binding-like beta-propeller repeat protein [Anaerolineae bacterium]|nr:PQQ-binding-like beta-propeller repeat protein [Anaerolineae bacterium]